MASIQGEKVKRPTKKELASRIAKSLGLNIPYVARGSSVDSTFLDRIHEALGHSHSAGKDAYRKTETVLRDLGLNYDPYWDTCESQPKGGSTVKARAYSRILGAITGEPRCFILPTTDAPVGARRETDHESVYRCDRKVSGRQSLGDAGPGSLVLYLSTTKSSRNKKMFVASARISYIPPGKDGPLEATVDSYDDFVAPLPSADVHIEKWCQSEITEIDYPTFLAITSAGGIQPPHEPSAVDREIAQVVGRLTKDFPVEAATPQLQIPEEPQSTIHRLPPAEEPIYEEDPDRKRLDSLDLPRRSMNAQSNKEVEQRAVGLVLKAFEDRGWLLEKDCQLDGVGYDLRFRKDKRELHVEVKGIQGSRLAFDMTPKEVWRLQDDPDFAVVAVTSALSPRNYQLRYLTSEHLAQARRVAAGWRFTVGLDSQN